jgi:CAAX prenyl protease-like protein
MYPARVVVALAVFACLRRDYDSIRGTFSTFPLTVGLFVFAFWSLSEPAPRTADEATVIPRSLAGLSFWWVALWIAGRTVGSMIVIPLAEELAFRGYLIRRLIAADFSSLSMVPFTWPSFLASSLLFGLLHQRWFAGTIAGMLFAAAYYHRGKLLDAVIARATANALITLYVFWTGDWYRWS